MPACSFCARDRSQVQHLVSARDTLFICNNCFGRYKVELRAETCSFCREDVESGLSGPNVFICDPCIELCRDISSEAKRALPSARVIKR
ncbi:MAG: ClpX C4-type zinc finger protein [Kofleriaceae bacterium]